MGVNMKTFLKSAAAAAILLAGQGTAFADDPIIGQWAPQVGPILSVEACGNQLCVKKASGPDDGEDAGTIERNKDGSYTTSVEDFNTGKPAAGTAILSENTITITMAQGSTEVIWMRH